MSHVQLPSDVVNAEEILGRKGALLSFNQINIILYASCRRGTGGASQYPITFTLQGDYRNFRYCCCQHVTGGRVMDFCFGYG